MSSFWRLYDTQHETDTRVGEYLMHPEGTPMGPWREKPQIAEEIGCMFFFVKYSKDKRYRIELEVNG